MAETPILLLLLSQQCILDLKGDKNTCLALQGALEVSACSESLS